jgi:putative SOS response-associated peptidase YedK
MRRFVQALSAIASQPLPLPAGVIATLAELPEHYNISVRRLAGVLFIRDERWKVATMSWGLVPSWEPAPETRYSTQTARLLRAPQSRLFRRSWAERRCVVPMNGYYKWDREASPRQPYFIQAASGEILFAAGMWSLWGEDFASFSLLTHPNPAIPPPLVPDGPCFVPPARIEEWILAAPTRARSLLLRIPPPALEAYPVSRRVARRELDDYTLLEPLDEHEVIAAGEDDESDILDEDD